MQDEIINYWLKYYDIISFIDYIIQRITKGDEEILRMKISHARKEQNRSNLFSSTYAMIPTFDQEVKIFFEKYLPFGDEKKKSIVEFYDNHVNELCRNIFIHTESYLDKLNSLAAAMNYRRTIIAFAANVSDSMSPENIVYTSRITNRGITTNLPYVAGNKIIIRRIVDTQFFTKPKYVAYLDKSDPTTEKKYSGRTYDHPMPLYDMDIDTWKFPHLKHHALLRLQNKNFDTYYYLVNLLSPKFTGE